MNINYNINYNRIFYQKYFLFLNDNENHIYLFLLERRWVRKEMLILNELEKNLLKN